MLWNYVDPFQLAVTFVATREMPGDEAHEEIRFGGHVNYSRGSCFPRVKFSSQIARDPGFPVVFGCPVRGANAGHRGDVGLASESVVHLRAEGPHYCIRRAALW